LITEDRNQKPEVRSQKPEDRSQKPEARKQKTEKRKQISQARGAKLFWLLAFWPSGLVRREARNYSGFWLLISGF
jgi:hypothetical protein